MSMEVDLSTPLTDEERKYLMERGKYADVERVDNLHGGETPDELLAGDGTGAQPVSVLTSDQMATRKERLLAELRAIEEAEQASDDSVGDDGDVPPYESWKAAELKKELKARNLSQSGSQDELVARLYEDDQRQQQTEQ